MKVADLIPNKKNPRTVTDEKLAQLKKALDEFGDLSGIVFNRKTKRLVGGHQRSKLLDKNAEIKIVKQFLKPTKVGTIAEGFIDVKGERFAYREVSWSEVKEKAANIAANKGAGEWDLPQLAEWLKEIDENFDIDLTLFDENEIKHLFPETKEVMNTSSEIDIEGITKLQHECPKCGFTFGASKNV
jgi:hypothetical protein